MRWRFSFVFQTSRADAPPTVASILLKDFDGFDARCGRKCILARSTPIRCYLFLAVYFCLPEELAHILGEIVSAAGKSQLRIAETEKYAARDLLF